MDNPGSDDDRLREAAAGEALITKKMKILITMLSLVLIILLLPLASNHGLPLLRPMGISMLQRLWSAMQFIAMTAAISIGIISTSNSQKNNKSFNGSARHRSSSSIRRPSAPINASGGREPINSNMINGIQSAHYNTQWQNIAGGDPHQGRGKETADSQKFKGKELVMNDLAFAASTSDTSFNSIREGEIFELETSPSRQAAQSPRLAPHHGKDHENFDQRPAKNNITDSRRRLSAGDIWFVPPRIDEEEEEYISASGARHGDVVSLTSRSRGESYVRKVDHLQKKASSMVDEDEDRSKKQIKTSADRRSMNVGTTSTTSDEYAELRMRRAANSRLVGDHVTGKSDQRRSSSVDRGRPIKYDYDKQSPDQPGLKQILMDLAVERASKGKLSNLSSGSEAYNNAANQRPVGVQDGSIHLQADHSKMGSSQIVQKQVDAKVGTVQIMQNQGTTDKNIAAASHQAPVLQLVDAKIVGSTQTSHKDNARMLLGSDQILQRNPGARVNYDSTMGSSVVSEGATQTQRRRNDAKAGLAHTVQRSNYQDQEEDPHPAYHKGPTTSKFLMQSSKHSRSAVNLEQLEQMGDSSSVHSTRPTSIRSSARKKSFSCDFGDGLNPDWLLKLEPPPPPGFFDQHCTDITTGLSPPTEAAQSDYTTKPPNPGFTNIVPPAPVLQSLVPWRSSNPIDISAYPRAASPVSPPDTASEYSATGPSPGEVNRMADEFISNFNTRLIRQRQESLERQRRYG